MPARANGSSPLCAVTFFAANSMCKPIQKKGVAPSWQIPNTRKVATPILQTGSNTPAYTAGDRKMPLRIMEMSRLKSHVLFCWD